MPPSSRLAAVVGLSIVLTSLPGTSRPLHDREEGSLFVWQVVNPSDADGTPDYLAGTIHLALPAHKRLPDTALRCLSDSDCFVMEADVETLQPDTIAPFIYRRDHRSNQRFLTTKAWQRTVRQAGDLGFRPDQVAAMEPWFLTTFLGTGPNDPNRSRDMLLRREAEERDLPVVYLEKAVDQLQMMRSLPADYFYDQLENLDETTAKGEALADAYENGDLPTVEAATFDPAEMRRFPLVYRRLFDDRNRRWLPTLETVLRRHHAFVAVGLGHLIGQNGLLRLLAAKGYRVGPVAMDRAPTATPRL